MSDLTGKWTAQLLGPKDPAKLGGLLKAKSKEPEVPEEQEPVEETDDGSN